MRILVVSSWFPEPPTNGSKLRAFHLLTQLSSRGHRVTLLSFAESGEAAQASALGGLCDDIEIVPGNPHKASRSLPALALFNRMPRSYATTYSRPMAGRIAARWRDHDALLALQVGAALYIDKRIGIPSVFDEAEVGVILERYRSERHPLRQTRHGLTWWKYAGFIRTLSRLATRTTTVSDVERQYLIDAGCDGARIDVVPNGVDSRLLDVIPPDVPADAPLIYPGAITYGANLDAVTYFTTDIVPRLTAQHPRMRLQVTGDTGSVDTGPLVAAGAVEFTGRVTSVTPLVQSARMCVVPLRVGGGTRLKILEALALGTPVVSTSKGIEGLDLKPEDDVLIGDDPEAFARQVIRLRNDNDLRARLSARGRQTVAQRYVWKLVGDALEQTLQRAVEQGDKRGSPAAMPARSSRGAA